MTAYTVLRFTKLKSWGAVGGAAAHNARRRPTPNADPKALPLNRHLIGSPGDDLAALCQARLGGQKIRQNAVYAVEGVMSASPAYFRPDGPEQYGQTDKARLDAWVKASMSWLTEKYGDRVMSAVLHLDEATPHIQFLILPIDEDGKLNCRKLFGGSRQVMADLQTDYAQAVACLGITRGRAGSTARHQEVAKFYAATQGFKPSPPPPVPAIAIKNLPEPPGPMARLSDKNLIAYAREAAAKAVEEQTAELAPALKKLTERNDILTAEVARLRAERERSKDEQARLSRENLSFKAEAKKLRDLPLDLVLVKMFGAEERRDSSSKLRRFQLPDGSLIEFSGSQWREGNINGKGAVNLVMRLSGYGQEHYQQAVRDLAETFGDLEATVSLAQHLAGTAPQEFWAAKQKNFQKPPSSDAHWPKIKIFMTEQLRLLATLIDQAHQDGLLYGDRRGNCIFERAGDSGIFRLALTGGSTTCKLGTQGSPFVLLGSDKSVYITDSPLEALALKALFPESQILATGGFMPADRLKPFLEGKEKIFLAQDANKLGEEYAKFLVQRFPQAKRFRPETGRTWSESWRLHREEKERGKAPPQAAVSAWADSFEKTKTPGFGR